VRDKCISRILRANGAERSGVAPTGSDVSFIERIHARPGSRLPFFLSASGVVNPPFSGGLVRWLYGGSDTDPTVAFTSSVIQLRKQRYILKYQRVTPLRVAEKKIIS